MDTDEKYQVFRWPVSLSDYRSGRLGLGWGMLSTNCHSRWIIGQNSVKFSFLNVNVFSFLHSCLALKTEYLLVVDRSTHFSASSSALGNTHRCFSPSFLPRRLINESRQWSADYSAMKIIIRRSSVYLKMRIESWSTHHHADGKSGDKTFLELHSKQAL